MQSLTDKQNKKLNDVLKLLPLYEADPYDGVIKNRLWAALDSERWGVIETKEEVLSSYPEQMAKIREFQGKSDEAKKILDKYKEKGIVNAGGRRSRRRRRGRGRTKRRHHRHKFSLSGRKSRWSFGFFVK